MLRFPTLNFQNEHYADKRETLWPCNETSTFERLSAADLEKWNKISPAIASDRPFYFCRKYFLKTVLSLKASIGLVR